MSDKKTFLPHTGVMGEATPGVKKPVIKNSWRKLKAYTDARVGLGRAGVSLPTEHLLAFQLAHAQAIDAVHAELNVSLLREQVSAQKWYSGEPPLLLRSRAQDRSCYLQRPDYGRRLNDDSAQILERLYANKQVQYDLVIAVVDGLSALAVEQNAIPFLKPLFALLCPRAGSEEGAQSQVWKIAPICLVEQGRVAIGDDICQRLQARCVLVLVGERPGLSSPDSLGAYLTWGAKVGCTDAYRNCISNIRPAGMSYQEAAHKAHYLLREAKKLGLSGVGLKDRTEAIPDDKIAQGRSNFLIN